jgi:hypothetical protein
MRAYLCPQDRSGRVQKISSLPGFAPWTAHPAASRYTGPHMNTFYGAENITETNTKYVSNK